ncbi:hypothetical protein BBJ28_00010527 [Nothophytophthora sp. Chile5]|nr:hypothetical protein BBJ28_00010527 [Nothophytophthora sp. Chile5]
MTKALARSVDYLDDLKEFYLIGAGYTINYEMAAVLLREIFATMKARATDDNGLVGNFFFAHAETTLPLMTLMGYGDRSRLLADFTEAEIASRAFRTSVLAPFAANVEFRLLQRKARDMEYYVQILVNEKEAEIPGCGRIFCRLFVWNHRFCFEMTLSDAKKSVAVLNVVDEADESSHDLQKVIGTATIKLATWSDAWIPLHPRHEANGVEPNARIRIACCFLLENPGTDMAVGNSKDSDQPVESTSPPRVNTSEAPLTLPLGSLLEVRVSRICQLSSAAAEYITELTAASDGADEKLSLRGRLLLVGGDSQRAVANASVRSETTHCKNQVCARLFGEDGEGIVLRFKLGPDVFTDEQPQLRVEIRSKRSKRLEMTLCMALAGLLKYMSPVIENQLNLQLLDQEDRAFGIYRFSAHERNEQLSFGSFNLNSESTALREQRILLFPTAEAERQSECGWLLVALNLARTSVETPAAEDKTSFSLAATGLGGVSYPVERCEMRCRFDIESVEIRSLPPFVSKADCITARFRMPHNNWSTELTAAKAETSRNGGGMGFVFSEDVHPVLPTGNFLKKTDSLALYYVSIAFGSEVATSRCCTKDDSDNVCWNEQLALPVQSLGSPVIQLWVWRRPTKSDSVSKHTVSSSNLSRQLEGDEVVGYLTVPVFPKAIEDSHLLRFSLPFGTASVSNSTVNGPEPCVKQPICQKQGTLTFELQFLDRQNPTTTVNSARENVELVIHQLRGELRDSNPASNGAIGLSKHVFVDVSIMTTLSDRPEYQPVGTTNVIPLSKSGVSNINEVVSLSTPSIAAKILEDPSAVVIGKVLDLSGGSYGRVQLPLRKGWRARLAHRKTPTWYAIRNDASSTVADTEGKGEASALLMSLRIGSTIMAKVTPLREVVGRFHVKVAEVVPVLRDRERLSVFKRINGGGVSVEITCGSSSGIANAVNFRTRPTMAEGGENNWCWGNEWVTLDHTEDSTALETLRVSLHFGIHRNERPIDGSIDLLSCLDDAKLGSFDQWIELRSQQEEDEAAVIANLHLVVSYIPTISGIIRMEFAKARVFTESELHCHIERTFFTCVFNKKNYTTLLDTKEAGTASVSSEKSKAEVLHVPLDSSLNGASNGLPVFSIQWMGVTKAVGEILASAEVFAVWKKLFYLLDQNGNGQIDRKEFTDVFVSHLEEMVEASDGQKLVQLLFDETNQDGNNGGVPTLQQVETLFTKIDTDHDNVRRHPIDLCFSISQVLTDATAASVAVSSKAELQTDDFKVEGRFGSGAVDTFDSTSSQEEETISAVGIAGASAADAEEELVASQLDDNSAEGCIRETVSHQEQPFSEGGDDFTDGSSDPTTSGLRELLEEMTDWVVYAAASINVNVEDVAVSSSEGSELPREGSIIIERQPVSPRSHEVEGKDSNDSNPTAPPTDTPTNLVAGDGDLPSGELAPSAEFDDQMDPKSLDVDGIAPPLQASTNFNEDAAGSGDGELPTPSNDDPTQASDGSVVDTIDSNHSRRPNGHQDPVPDDAEDAEAIKSELSAEIDQSDHHVELEGAGLASDDPVQPFGLDKEGDGDASIPLESDEKGELLSSPKANVDSGEDPDPTEIKGIAVPSGMVPTSIRESPVQRDVVQSDEDADESEEEEDGDDSSIDSSDLMLEADAMGTLEAGVGDRNVSPSGRSKRSRRQGRMDSMKLLADFRQLDEHQPPRCLQDPEGS